MIPLNIDSIDLFWLNQVTRVIPTSSDGLEWIWVHCDRKFTGYYETDYTAQNWEYLGTSLNLKNNVNASLFQFSHFNYLFSLIKNNI